MHAKTTDLKKFLGIFENLIFQELHHQNCTKPYFTFTGKDRRQ
jgi:hypothetical protein